MHNISTRCSCFLEPDLKNIEVLNVEQQAEYPVCMQTLFVFMVFPFLRQLSKSDVKNLKINVINIWENPQASNRSEISFY